MSCLKRLTHLTTDTFEVYVQAHADHFNVVGPNFHQDHSFFQEVYESLHSWYDTLGEQQRQLGSAVPVFVGNKASSIKAHDNDYSTSTCYNRLYDNLQVLKNYTELLFKESGEENRAGLNTVVGDFAVDLSKLIWKVEATGYVK